jgi:predicted RNA binding protein with dsRBD fold (UPF0201 family)
MVIEQEDSDNLVLITQQHFQRLMDGQRIPDAAREEVEGGQRIPDAAREEVEGDQRNPDAAREEVKGGQRNPDAAGRPTSD